MTTTPRRAGVLALAVSMSAIALLGAGIAPASAADEAPMSISDDGVTFSQSAGSGLLDSLGLLVPGDSESASMWVRNDSGAPAVVRVSIRDLVTPSRVYADGVSLATWNSGTDQTISNSLRTTSRCSVIVPSQSIAAGATMRFQLTFAMADFDDQQAQGQSAGMSLMIAMRDAEGGAFAASACDDDGVLITPTPAPSPQGQAPGTSTTPAPGSVVGGTPSAVAPFSASADDVQLPTESVPSADPAPLDITVWGFTLLRLTGEDLTALFIISAGLASGMGMFVLAARRRREREES